jgi:hypothetical protein
MNMSAKASLVLDPFLKELFKEKADQTLAWPALGLLKTSQNRY